MFCDHVNNAEEGTLVILPDGTVMCPDCAKPCGGCGTITRAWELDESGCCRECYDENEVLVNEYDIEVWPMASAWLEDLKTKKMPNNPSRKNLSQPPPNDRAGRLLDGRTWDETKEVK